MDKVDLAVDAVGLVGGMVGSQILAKEIAKMIPIKTIPHLEGGIELGLGAGIAFGLGNRNNKAGKAVQMVGGGAMLRGILDLLNVSIPYIASAGEQTQIIAPMEDTTVNIMHEQAKI